MICTKCGARIDDGSKFCAECGAAVPAEPQYQQPQYTAQPQYQQPQYNAVPVYNQSVSSTPVLTWGIIGLAFACSFFLSFLGIIFSAVGRGKANTYLNQVGQLTGKAKVGSILSKVGLILGIVLTVVFIIYIIAIVGLIASF